MLIFTPDYLFEKTTDITPEFLHALGVKNLILDVDNTLTTHDNPTPGQGVPGWLDLMRAEGFNMMIVSNNHRERVTPVSYTHLDVYKRQGKSPYIVCHRLFSVGKKDKIANFTAGKSLYRRNNYRAGKKYRHNGGISHGDGSFYC